MLLNVIKKMIHFDEAGSPLTSRGNEHNSIVGNFSGQIQANLRFNLRSEFNNSSNTMKKIYEICYLFYKVCYKNDKELFLSQFWLFYDPVFSLTKSKSRDDSIYRLKFLCKILGSLLKEEESVEEALRILSRKEGGPQELLDTLECFLDDTLGVLLSGSTQKSQVETLKIRFINDKLEVNLYIETIPTVIAAYMSLTTALKLKLNEKTQKKIKFVLSYVLISDHLLKKIVSSLDKTESKVEVYDIERYFEDRRSVLSSLNVLLENNFSFTEGELELIYRVLMNYIRIEVPDFLQLIKDFCFLSLKSAGIPKDRALLELINLFPSGQVKMAGIMAGLHKAISSQEKHRHSQEGEFDLDHMGETVIGRFLQESLSLNDITEEFKQSSVMILTLDFELSNDNFSKDVVEKYRKGIKSSQYIFLVLIAKCERETAVQIITSVLKSDFLLFYQSLISFTELVKENKKSLSNKTSDLIKIYEASISCILDSLQAKKSEEVEKKLNLFMLALQSLCDLMVESQDDSQKKQLILLIYASSDFLLGKIPARFFDERVLPLTSKVI